MTRSLRKRHLIIWTIIVIVVSALMILARTSMPKFQGDQPTEQIDS